jgi:RNA polymerase sigma-70 factor, ECF subfamily
MLVAVFSNVRCAVLLAIGDKVQLNSVVQKSVTWFPTVLQRPKVSAEQKASDDLKGRSDEELLAMLQVRDLEALSLLFGRYARLVLTIGLRILRDAGEAEDLVQDVFLRIFEKAHTFDRTKGCARTWIVQVAYRYAVGRRAHLGRRGFYDGTDLNRLENALLQDARVEEQVGARITGEQLLGALEQLNEKQHTTLHLYFFEDLELREIAERLGETLENTRHYFYRGLDRLRKNALVSGIMQNRKTAL